MSRRRDLEAALDRAEAAATRRGGSLSSPLRRLRPLVRQLAGPEEVTCRVFTGARLRVVLPEIVGTQLYRHGYIEPSLTRVLLERLQPGMAFVDVGAQYGYYAALADLLVGPGGTVVAFEPAQSSFRLLRHNVGHLGTVHTVDAALHSSSGTTELRDFGLGHSAVNTLLPTPRIPAAEGRRLRATTYPVRRTTLDEYVEATGIAPDVVKLDAEGAELEILRGMTRVLDEAAPLLAVETGDYDDMAAPATTDCIGFLEDRGYRCLEWAGGLRPHRRRTTYGYGNLFFAKDGQRRGD